MQIKISLKQFVTFTMLVHNNTVEYRVSNIEVYLLKVLKNIENQLVFVNTWAFFLENLGHFDIHALPLQKI